MRELRDSVHIDAAPEQVWSWLTDLPEHYTEWHPDHVSAEWERGDFRRTGSIMTAIEFLGGRREELRFELTYVDPPGCIEYRFKGPHALLLAGGAFNVAGDDGGARFTACIRYRFGILTERLFRRRITTLRTHMREEGENLKRLVEARRDSGTSPQHVT